jgi:signal transduction histidine kinase
MKIRLGLSGKVLLGITALFLLITITTSIVSAWNLDRSLTSEFRTKGAAIANSIANSSVETLLTRRGSSLQAMVDEFLQIPGVGYVFVVDGNNAIVSHTFVPAIPAMFLGEGQSAAASEGAGVTLVDIDGMGKYLDVTAPILAGIAGVVHVGMDRSVIEAQVRSAVLLQAAIMLAIFGLSVSLAWVYVTRIARPLGVLTAHAHKIAANQRLRDGDGAAAMSEAEVEAAAAPDPELAKLAAGATDEVGELAVAFQDMEEVLRRYIGNLRRAHLDLAEHNRTLEDKVNDRTHELRGKNDELESAMSRLKEAQDQIVTQQKLASLGALTAGVAHEIKNPLNFITNFAQLSDELTAEMKEAASKLPAETSAELVDLADMLQMNVRKINEHGKRADSIVRNMLLHSRTKQGERAEVDVNAMLQEYVGLAYHGMRGQDQSFNAKIDTRLDPAVGTIEAVPQDLGRAFLNLLTNACYAIHDKQKQLGASFAPVLSVSTAARGDGSVEIRIRDNGNGIPESVRAKMFEPFFTTKPAGAGTGLGLSMTFDIIVQSHKGAIDVETAPGEFAEFIITLPRKVS